MRWWEEEMAGVSRSEGAAKDISGWIFWHFGETSTMVLSILTIPLLVKGSE